MTNVAGVTGYATSMAGAGNNEKKTGPLQELGKDAFLQLLVTQLRYQDPLSSKDSTDFIVQMAQFTMLEQLQNLNASMTSLLSLQPPMQSMAPMYLGLKVTVRGEDNSLEEGTVSAVNFVGGSPYLEVNGRRYALEDVLKVTTGGE
jgi:flagellar basal-body rod modification protein FlgD